MTTSPSTDLRLRQPAEWAPHEACWLAWPSHVEQWGKDLAAAQAAFVELCRAIADVDPATGLPRGERLEVMIVGAEGEAEAAAALAGLGCRFQTIPYGDIWLRDIGPIFVSAPGGGLQATCFRFNGWGGKYLFEHDAEVAGRVAAAAGVPARTFAAVIEGGAVDVDGEGTCLTTRQCLLNANRNPGLSERDLERTLEDALGIERVLWLDEGLHADHTDGHVDNLARFVGPGTVVCMNPSGADDPNRDVLLQIQASLSSFRDAGGRRLTVERIPSPGRVLGADGKVAPASYANFLIANRTVVVPTYGTPYDDAALRRLAALFVGREVIGVRCNTLLEGGGALHCITQQQPALSGEEG